MGDHNLHNADQIEGDNVPLRSRNSRLPAFVSFINKTERIANVLWIDFNGQRKTYTQNGLLPNRRLDMRTFEGHPWITRDYQTGDMMEFCDHGTGKTIYLPERWDGSRNYRAPIVQIRIPAYSLYERSLQVVRKLIPNRDDVEELQIPKQVKYDLIHVKDTLP